MNPILHIVMGPNGAGKSTFGSLYTDGIPVYDPDKRGMEIRTYIKNLSKSQRKQLYPAYTNDMFEELFDELTADYQWEEYDELRKHCIADSIDFALETPFADNFGLNQVLYFKAHGYHIHGIFVGLNTVAQSIANVSLRVKKKGHDLPLQSIEWNFNQCYVNLKKYMGLFESILFMDAQNPLNNPVLVAQYKDNRFMNILPGEAGWLRRLT